VISKGSHKIKTIDVIIQARITSSRLPGKILKRIGGKTVLEIMHNRLSFSKKINKIIYAIPKNKKNKKLLNFIKLKKYYFFEGSEKNVLKRYYFAAKKFNCQNIMRLTSDCPLIDYRICNKLINIFQKKKIDHIYTGQTFAEGLDVEILSFKTLEKIYKNARSEIEKEHVTFYIKRNLKKFKSKKIENTNNCSKYRFTLDEKEDLVLIKKIVKQFPKILKNIYVSSNRFIEFLKKNQKIYNINSYIIRNEGLLKSLKKEQKFN
jgi:spore coat polysaccharide biosynthesis protein SpsF